jgi:hypothetical protein
MIIFLGFPVLTVLAMLIVHGSSSLDKLRQDWPEYRCNPAYMPFAGTIRPDITTTQNMYYCIGEMSNEIFKPLLTVINSLFDTINKTLFEVTGSIGSFAVVFSRIRNFMLSFLSGTFSKITGLTNTISYTLIKIQDVLRRFVSQGYIGTYFMQIGVDFVMSFVMLCISIIKGFVYALLAISILLIFGGQIELLVLAATVLGVLGSSGFL